MIRGQPGPAATVLIRVEWPQGDYLTLRQDSLDRSLRLESVVSQPEPLPCELGVVLGAADERGRGLPAALLIRRPTFPGCLVDAKLIGVLRLASPAGTQSLVIAAALADPGNAARSDLESLDEDLRQRLVELARGSSSGRAAPNGSPGSGPSPPPASVEDV